MWGLSVVAYMYIYMLKCIYKRCIYVYMQKHTDMNVCIYLYIHRHNMFYNKNKFQYLANYA